MSPGDFVMGDYVAGGFYHGGFVTGDFVMGDFDPIPTQLQDSRILPVYLRK